MALPALLAGGAVALATRAPRLARTLALVSRVMDPADSLVDLARGLKSLEQADDLIHELKTARVRDRAQGAAEVAMPKATELTDGTVLLTGAPDARTRAALRRIKPEPNTLDVIVHGQSDRFDVVSNGQRVQVDHRVLAKLIKKSAQEAKTIRLISCRSGAHPDAIARDLANKLGVPVKAPTDVLHLHSDGRLTVGRDPDRPSGKWQLYTPGRPRNIESVSVVDRPRTRGPSVPQTSGKREVNTVALGSESSKAELRRKVIALREAGLDKQARRAFLGGRPVVVEVPSPGGNPTIITFRLSKKRLEAGIFSVHNTTGSALRDFAGFRGRARKLARHLGVGELELQGLAVHNDEIEALLTRRDSSERLSKFLRISAEGPSRCFSKCFR